MGDGETKGGGVMAQCTWRFDSICGRYACCLPTDHYGEHRDTIAGKAWTPDDMKPRDIAARPDPAAIDELRLVAAHEGMRREAVAGVVEKAPPTVDYERVDTYEIKRDEKAIAASHAMMAQAREQTDGLLFKIIVDKPAPTFDLAPLRNLATAIIMPMLIENARDEWIDYHPRGTLTWDRGQDDAEYGYEHAISLRYGVAGTPWTRDDSVFTAGADFIGGDARAAWEDFAQWLAREHARSTPSDAAEVEARRAIEGAAAGEGRRVTVRHWYRVMRVGNIHNWEITVADLDAIVAAFDAGGNSVPLCSEFVDGSGAVGGAVGCVVAMRHDGEFLSVEIEAAADVLATLAWRHVVPCVMLGDSGRATHAVSMATTLTPVQRGLDVIRDTTGDRAGTGRKE